MTGRDLKNDADRIGEIIGAEEEQALARFRSSRFGERLKRALEEQPAASPLTARAPSVLRPVWISLAVLAALAAAATWLFRPRSPALVSGGAVEALFHGLPGFQAIENPPPPLSAGSGDSGSPLERNIAFVLGGPARPEGKRSHERGGGHSLVTPRPEPLGLERVYEILIIDKSVERVLADLSPKTKEG